MSLSAIRSLAAALPQVFPTSGVATGAGRSLIMRSPRGADWVSRGATSPLWRSSAATRWPNQAGFLDLPAAVIIIGFFAVMIGFFRYRDWLFCNDDRTRLCLKRQ